MVYFIIFAPFFALALIVIGIYNHLVKQRTLVHEAFATMDVYLKQRYDLVPGLVATVKSYSQYEQSTLLQVVDARNQAASAHEPTTKLAHESVLSHAIKDLFALSEAYPDLKANTTYLKLQEQLTATEKDLAQARKYYNACSRSYNYAIAAFPNFLLANLWGFKPEPLFELQNQDEKDPVRVDLTL